MRNYVVFLLCMFSCVLYSTILEIFVDITDLMIFSFFVTWNYDKQVSREIKD